MNKAIKYAAIAGIQLVVLGLFLTIININESPKTLEDFKLIIYLIVYVFCLIFSIVFFWGFNIIGEKTHNNLLQIISHIFIFSSVIFHIFIFIPIKPLIFPIIFDPDLSYSVILFIGFIGIIFGVGLLTLKKQFGFVAISAGALEIITNFGYLVINLPREIIGDLGHLMVNFPMPFISVSGYLTINLPIIPTLIIILAHSSQIVILFKGYKEL